MYLEKFSEEEEKKTNKQHVKRRKIFCTGFRREIKR